MGITRYDSKAQLGKRVRDFIALDEQIKELEKKRKELTDILLPIIDLEGPLRYGDKQVVRCVSGGRRPTKEDIVAQFGEIGELFWNRLKPVSYEYLSVVLKK